MSKTKGTSQLELGEDDAFERRGLIVERCGWGCMFLVIVAAVLGFFGGGPWSFVRVASADGSLAVEYQRYVRTKVTETLAISAEAPAVQGEEVHIWLGKDFLGNVEIERTDPPAERVIFLDDGRTYVFLTRQRTQPARVTFHWKALRAGRLNCGVKGGNNATLNLTIFSYP